jgi:hypothetical protein
MITKFSKEKGIYEYVIIFHKYLISSYLLFNRKNKSILILFMGFIPYKVMVLPPAITVSNKIKPSVKDASIIVHSTREKQGSKTTEHYKVYRNSWYWQSYFNRAPLISFRRLDTLYTKDLILSLTTLLSTLYGHKFNRILSAKAKAEMIYSKISIIRYKV